MDPIIIIVGAVILALIVGVAGWFVGKAQSSPKIAELSRTIEHERRQHTDALEHERRQHGERVAFINNTFAAVATQALRQNNDDFLALAEERLKRQQDSADNQLQLREKAIESLITPVRETLERFEARVQDIERARVGAYEGLTAQVKGLFDSQKELRSETANLVGALKSPRIRGRWGEIQLRRVVELSGMLNRCDFVEQKSVSAEDRRLRPDMIVRLPGGSTIVIDAKSPLDRYLLAMEVEDDAARQEHLGEYANQIRGHMSALSSKGYWEQFNPAPEFVFMFLPGESFFSAALAGDPLLIEAGANQRVILATPTTLIALLKAVAYGWRQERLAEDAERIGSLGKELYERMAGLADHFVGIGGALRTAVDKYNSAVGALESRVLVSARRFKDLPITASDKEIKPALPVDTIPRELQAPEFAPPPGD
jgi:DNA recombination protein RmuC